MSTTSPRYDDDVSITHPCGHASTLDAGLLRRDHFRCPSCGLRWHMHTDPPILHPNGWIEPGARMLIIDPKPEMALS